MSMMTRLSSAIARHSTAGGLGQFYPEWYAREALGHLNLEQPDTDAHSPEHADPWALLPDIDRDRLDLDAFWRWAVHLMGQMVRVVEPAGEQGNRVVERVPLADVSAVTACSTNTWYRTYESLYAFGRALDRAVESGECDSTLKRYRGVGAQDLVDSVVERHDGQWRAHCYSWRDDTIIGNCDGGHRLALARYRDANQGSGVTIPIPVERRIFNNGPRDALKGKVAACFCARGNRLVLGELERQAGVDARVVDLINGGNWAVAMVRCDGTQRDAIECWMDNQPGAIRIT